ncbi:Mpo1 family 2-hydroxy fatty acid dioxygenase [Adhaeribacter radiodurans]|uniref:DUF962 domain-containing protein n=1 Tax=Adhaeribacter radiodurans TaxID=2745197 RepID=A0A7L7L1R7_9BACT|nr:Mpo1-like protein [Adhaeribacter radiodurans]QMU26736.1 DUF962 domain-containing protein [Adhaeribacter radiodurans]
MPAVVNRTLDTYFDKYAESHENPVNKLIHWICVPLIVFSLLGLVWSIPFPQLSFLGAAQRYFNWATFLIIFSIIYYFRLSVPLALTMLLIISVFSAIIITLEILHRENGWLPLWQVCLYIFVLAWIGQFIGHKIEGKKPSFLDDLKFLLIGPLWLLHFIFKKVGLRY